MRMPTDRVDDSHRVHHAKLGRKLLDVQKTLLSQSGRRYEDARIALEVLRPRAVQILGPQDPAILLIDVQLAELYQCMGKRALADRIEARIFARKFDDEIGQLGWIMLEAQRKRKDAREAWENDVRVLLQLARARADHCLGAEHPVVALVEAQLADIYVRTGRLDNASRLRSQLFAEGTPDYQAAAAS